MKFRCIDAIREWKPGESIRGVKAVSFEEFCLRERLGMDARLPESLLLESFFQLGNWLILLSTDFTQCGMIVRIDRVEFAGAVNPGERVELEVKVERRRDEGRELSGCGTVGQREVARGFGCLAATVPAEELYHTEDLRVLFEEIHRPVIVPNSS